MWKTLKSRFLFLTPTVTVFCCVLNEYGLLRSEQQLCASTKSRICSLSCLSWQSHFDNSLPLRLIIMWKTEFWVCWDGVNHVSVPSLSLMLLFKTTVCLFLKPIYVLNCFQVIFDFLKCTEVIWKTGCRPGPLPSTAPSSPGAEPRAWGLGVGCAVPQPQHRAETAGVSVGSRWCAAEELKYLALVQKPNRLPDKKETLEVRSFL